MISAASYYILFQGLSRKKMFDEKCAIEADKKHCYGNHIELNPSLKVRSNVSIAVIYSHILCEF